MNELAMNLAAERVDHVYVGREPILVAEQDEQRYGNLSMLIALSARRESAGAIRCAFSR
jgi:hypothetical protein